jgi:hypothetical protein
MPRKKQPQSQSPPEPETLDEIVARAAAAPTGRERQRIAAKGRSLATEMIKKARGRGQPTKYSKAMADRIIGLIKEGKTLTKIGTELSISLQDIYAWLDLYPDFLENYIQARKLMSITLIDSLMDQSEKAEKDEALLLKTRAGIYQWIASKYHSDQFSDKRTLQVNGTVQHQHTHQLSVDQRRRIAESWLMSQSDNPHSDDW